MCKHPILQIQMQHREEKELFTRAENLKDSLERNKEQTELTKWERVQLNQQNTVGSSQFKEKKKHQPALLKIAVTSKQYHLIQLKNNKTEQFLL